VVAVTDVDAAAARAASARFGVPSYADHEALLADPRVQAVIVATPHSTHEAITVAAALAGKHIFCEKPIAIDVAAAYRMIDAADAAGVKLMVGQVVRLYPLFRRVAEIVEADRLGLVVAANVEGLYNITRVRWWARAATMGALLHSPGVHDIDFLRALLGEVRGVFAREAPVQIQPGVDYKDVVHVSLRFESGAIATLVSSVANLVPCRRGNLLGVAGSLAFDAVAGTIDVATTSGEREHIDLSDADNTDGVRAELQSFVDWVTRAAPPLLTGWDGLRAVEVIDAAYHSIREQREITLPLPRPATSRAAGAGQ
jgi:predicted dehydrogenase